MAPRGGMWMVRAANSPAGAGSAMSLPALSETFLRFLNEPSRENYVAAWREVVRAPGYAPYSDELKALAAAFERGEHAEVLDAGERLLPNFLLTPSLHFYLGRASGALGDTEREDLERFLFRKCRDGLLATGDGTPEAPYLVAHADDEYEVLEMLGRTPVKQSLVTHESGRVFDVFSEEDERETWFDVTEMAKHMRRPETEEGDVSRN